MATKSQDDGMELKIKILPPEPSEVPAAIFANHVFVSRQEDETWLVFCHVRAPMGSRPTDEKARLLREEGVVPALVGSVVLPNVVAYRLSNALQRVVPASDEAENGVAE
jgi:hypothetical protein